MLRLYGWVIDIVGNITNKIKHAGSVVPRLRQYIATCVIALTKFLDCVYLALKIVLVLDVVASDKPLRLVASKVVLIILAILRTAKNVENIPVGLLLEFYVVKNKLEIIHFHADYYTKNSMSAQWFSLLCSNM